MANKINYRLRSLKWGNETNVQAAQNYENLVIQTLASELKKTGILK